MPKPTPVTPAPGSGRVWPLWVSDPSPLLSGWVCTSLGLRGLHLPDQAALRAACVSPQVAVRVPGAVAAGLLAGCQLWVIPQGLWARSPAGPGWADPELGTRKQWPPTEHPATGLGLRPNPVEK